MTHPPTEVDSVKEAKAARAKQQLLGAISVALGLVILAPVLLSSQDLYAWGRTGLGLDRGWAVLVPIALDCAAVVCIGMTIVATWRRERPGIFELLVWVFAGTSAYAQYTHGIEVRATAPAAYWAFPAFALLGPVLLHVTLSRLRKWARTDANEQLAGAAGFGARWIPGVAFKETLSAWAASRREGISEAHRAIAYVRETTAIESLTGEAALRYAFRALDSYNVHAAEVWLQARGRVIDQADIDAAMAGRPRAIAAAPTSPAPAGSHLTPDEMHKAALAACSTNRQRIAYAYSVLGAYDQAAAGRLLAKFDYSASRSELSAVAKGSAQAGPGLDALTAGSGSYPTVPARQLNGYAHDLAAK